MTMAGEHRGGQPLWSEHLDLLIRARTPILWIWTIEEERVERLLKEAALRLGNRTLMRWDFISGLEGLPNRAGEASRQPMQALQALGSLPQAYATIAAAGRFPPVLRRPRSGKATAEPIEATPGPSSDHRDHRSPIAPAS